MTLKVVKNEASQAEIEEHLRLLNFKVYGLRVLGGKGVNGRKLFPAEGYFDNAEQAAAEAMKLTSAGYDSVYVVLNELHEEVLDRSPNAFTQERGSAASDNDVRRYRHLLLDFDPVRLSGIASTQEELQAALARAGEVRDWLSGLEWPDPVYQLGSGNGAHLVYRISLETSPENRRLIRETLQALDARWSDDLVKVDTKVHNPARITKLAGVWSRKGGGTAERPHRVSWLIDRSPKAAKVKVPKIRALSRVLSASKEGQGEKRAPRDLTEFLARCEEEGLEPKSKPWNDVTLVDLKCWREEHGNRSGYVVFREDGKIVAKCHHESCDANTLNLIEHLGWKDEVPKIAPDDARRIVEMVNDTGLSVVWEGDALLYVVAKEGSRIRRWKTQQNVRTFLDHFPRLVNDDGHETHAFSVWSRSNDRREAHGVNYTTEAPYGAITGEGEDSRLNMWAGLDYEKKRHANGAKLVKAYREHLQQNICAGDKKLATYLWRLFAWKVKNPLDLPLVLVILTGPQGSGKNTAVLPLVNLFGEAGLHSQSKLSRFNTKLEGKAIVFHDEAEFLAAPQVMQGMKALVTEQQLTYEQKGVDSYQGRNLAFHIAASNNPRIHIEATDRRILLLETRAPKEGAAWFRDRGLHQLIGAADLDRPESVAFHETLLHELLRTKLPGDWRPYPAPQTEARGGQIADHLDALELWVGHALARGEVPGLADLGRGGLPRRWPEESELVIEARERVEMWESFRKHVDSSGRWRAQAVTGYGSLNGFMKVFGRLVGGGSKVVKHNGVPQRQLRCRKLSVTREAYADSLGVNSSDWILEQLQQDGE